MCHQAFVLVLFLYYCTQATIRILSSFLLRAGNDHEAVQVKLLASRKYTEPQKERIWTAQRNKKDPVWIGRVESTSM